MAGTNLVLILKCSKSINHQSKRYAHFFNQITGDKLWNSVSPNTSKKGRGKRAKKKQKQDLGRNKILGDGKDQMYWPGLNMLSASGFKVGKQNAETRKIIEERNKKSVFLRKPKTVERGWTAGQFGGIKLAPPVGENGKPMNDFHSNILEVRRVSHMHRSVGRVYGIRAMVAVGNKKGLFGVGHCVSPTINAAAKIAQDKAIKYLQYIERCEDRTIFEDVYVNHHKTYIHLRKQPPGYGLRCHRAIQTMCQLIGISDLHAKTTGATTMINLVKCLLKGLHSQETYQDKANRTGYHVVMQDELQDNYPIILASPTTTPVKTQPFDEYAAYLNQNIVIKRKPNHIHWYPLCAGPPIDNPEMTPKIFDEILDAEL